MLVYACEMRLDAEENEARILFAARHVFAEGGEQAPITRVPDVRESPSQPCTGVSLPVTSSSPTCTLASGRSAWPSTPSFFAARTLRTPNKMIFEVVGSLRD